MIKRKGPPEVTAGRSRGMVTAELAVGTIAVVLLLALCVGVASLIVTQLRCVDLASELARQSARDDEAAVAAARRTVPAGGQVEIRRSGDSVIAVVTAPVRLPPLPPVTVTGRAETVVEPGS